MRKLLLLLFLTAGIYLSASAKLKLPYCTGCEYVEHVADLPDSAEFYSDENKAFVEVGYIYKQFWAIWVPIWNYDGKYVLYVKDSDVYFEVDDTTLKKYADIYGFNTTSSPISFWNKLGGKLLLAVLIGLGIWGSIPSKKKSDDTPVVSKSN